jgi:hypothetical protein
VDVDSQRGDVLKGSALTKVIGNSTDDYHVV